MQNNTDKHVLEMFDKNFVGTMIETGAGPTTEYSMSKLFREKGWRTICIEPNAYYVELHEKEGNEIYRYALSDFMAKDHDFEVITLHGPEYDNNELSKGIAYSSIKLRYNEAEFYTKKIIKVDIVTLNWLLESIDVNHIDFISIDVEGWELDVMRGFDTLKYKPKIIVLENYKHDKSYDLYMNSIGYSLSNMLAHNYIYTRNE